MQSDTVPFSRQRTYIAIDLKSFYSSVECVERDLDPLDTNLVVADESRTDKTICLAVSPSLKSFGAPGRGRLFEVRQKIKEVNALRRDRAPGHVFSGASCFFSQLQSHPELEADFIIAPPRMAYYLEYSSRIYRIFEKYVAPEDMIVYSIDEVFMDVTDYLDTYKLTARDLAMKMILDVYTNTGITATAGIGTNLFLCKVAMDIEAKHIPADQNGVRIAELDERSFREKLWDHMPLTDFWRVGRGYAGKLEKYGIHTMGDIARCSVRDEDLLYRLFGKNAELLIDHAWGWEPCTIRDVKAYKPDDNSISSGQVLQRPYKNGEAKLVLREMADALALDLVNQRLVTDQIGITVGYDAENLADPSRKNQYHGETMSDHYDREIPRQAHGTSNLRAHTSSTKEILAAADSLFDRLVDPSLLIRRLNITAFHVIDEHSQTEDAAYDQIDLFADPEREAEEKAEQEKERNMQEALLTIKKQFGKNAVLKGMNFEEGATGRNRNEQIGGHRA
ncbi:MAG: DNA methylase [Oscillospiraceae bacterium]|nr:DNA methylase [Oscillospiraceae bacterium]